MKYSKRWIIILIIKFWIFHWYFHPFVFFCLFIDYYARIFLQYILSGHGNVAFTLLTGSVFSSESYSFWIWIRVHDERYGSCVVQIKETPSCVSSSWSARSRRTRSVDEYQRLKNRRGGRCSSLDFESRRVVANHYGDSRRIGVEYGKDLVFALTGSSLV